jgi:hypothetical protein
MKTKRDLLKEKLNNFAAHVRLLFSDHKKIMADLELLSTLPIDDVAKYIATNFNRDAEEVVSDILAQYQIDRQKLDPELLTKFKRYIMCFRSLCT